MNTVTVIRDDNGSITEYNCSYYPIQTIEAYLDIKERYNIQRKYPWHPCSHVKVNVLSGNRDPYLEYPTVFGIPNPFGDPITYGYGGKITPYGWNAFPEATVNPFLGNLGSGGGLLPSGIGGHHSREAIRNVTQQVDTEVSIANFLWELKDGLKALMPRFSGNVAEKVGGNWLWWNFGALPLVSDTMKLLKLTETVHKRLEHLKRVNRRTTTTVYKAYWSNQNVPSHIEGDAGAFSHGAWNGLPQIEWQTAFLRMNIRTYIDLDLYGADAFFQAMVSALGLHDWASIVWEAIPFSFVVDWFGNVSEWLEDNIDVSQPFKGEIQILGSDHTIKKRTMFRHMAETSNLIDRSYAPVASVLVTEYHRRSGPFGGELSEDGLSPLQLSLGAALLSQGLGGIRLPRRR